MTKLKLLMEDCGLSQRALARAMDLSPAAVNEIVNRDNWPKSLDKGQLQGTIRRQLRAAGAEEGKVKHLFRPSRARITTNQKQEDDVMLLRKQGLYPQTKRHFNLVRDPFGDVQDRGDVFLSKDLRYVRDALYMTARNGGFLALIGESGSGKSTLREELADRIKNEHANIHIIEPFVLGMEDNDKTGKTLRSAHISEAIMSTVAPLESLNGSPEARFRQLKKALTGSCKAGHSHCLIIEEAHALPIPTIKHLKRFLELKDGMKRLLSVILLGQPELKQKLSETNHQVREVVQRCEIVELLPMNGSLPEYIKFRFERIGVEAEKVITADAIEALRSKLTGPASTYGASSSVSMVYPLAVGNLVIAAMNLAADVGAPVVTPDIIAEV